MKQVVGEERALPISQRVISSPKSPQRLRVFAVGVGRITTLCHGKDMWCDRHPFPSSHALLLVALRRNRLRGSPNGEEEKREADWKQEDPEAWITPVYKPGIKNSDKIKLRDAPSRPLPDQFGASESVEAKPM
jgi:hypothetical protein